MKTGVGFPSYTGATYAAAGAAAADASYPFQNLDSKASLRTPFRAAAPGVTAFQAIFPAAQLVQLFAFLHHNAPDGAVFRIRAFSDNNPDVVGNIAHIVYDSGNLPFYPIPQAAQATYPAVRPVVLAVAVSVRSLRVDFSANAAIWEFGGFEVAGWWAWDAVEVARNLGLAAGDTVIEAPDGATHGMGQFAPRIWKGGRSALVTADDQSKILDFQFAMGISKPFVFMWDYEDPSTWARECFVARNASLPGFSKSGSFTGDFSADLVEHMR